MKADPRAIKIARLLSYVIGFILVLLPFHEFLAVWLGSNTGHLDLIRIWKEILITCMVPPATWLMFKSPKLKTWFKTSWVTRLFGLYIILHLGLGLWALHSQQVNRVAFIYALIINLRFIGFFLICLVVASYDQRLKNYWRQILLLPGTVVIAFGISQKLFLPADFLRHFGYGPKTIPAYQTVDSNNNYTRVQSTLRGANPLGAYLALIIPAAILSLWRRRNFAKAVYILLGLVCLFFTYSRSAWMGLAVALVALTSLKFGKLNRRIIYSIAAIAALGVIASYSLSSSQSLQDTLLHTSNSSHSSVSSNAQRSSAIKQGAHDVAHQPLGRGPGTAGPASFRNNHPARIAEDYYLQLGQEVGIIGLSIFLAINLLVARELYKTRSDNLSKLLLVTLIGISFINLVSHAWADDTLSLIWWGLAGVALAFKPKASATKSN